MTVKEKLNQGYYLNTLIDANLIELEALKQLALSVPSPNLSGLPSGNQKTARFVNPVQKLVDLEIEINKEIDQFVDLKKEIRELIKSLSENKLKLVMTYRYLLFYKWDIIAEKMNMSLRQVHRLHDEALKKLS